MTPKIAKNRHLGTIAQLCWTVGLSSKLRHVSTIGKSLLNNNTTSTYLHNTVIVCSLTVEIG